MVHHLPSSVSPKQLCALAHLRCTRKADATYVYKQRATTIGILRMPSSENGILAKQYLFQIFQFAMLRSSVPQETIKNTLIF